MDLAGWIREGDQAACNGMVIEGDQLCVSQRRAYAFEGALLVCQRKCSIAEVFVRRRLTNGPPAVLHGMKTCSPFNATAASSAAWVLLGPFLA